MSYGACTKSNQTTRTRLSDATRAYGDNSATDYAGETDVPDTVRDVISSPGQSLDADIQRTMESEMGNSFSDVQVHTGPKAAQACEDINAKAFTVGNNIAFNQGEYDPGSAEGQHTIAHELAHVRQQTGGAVSMLPQDDLDLEIDPDPELEQEAEETAQRVMQGGKLGIHRMADTDVHVQRSFLDRFRDSESQESDQDTQTDQPDPEYSDADAESGLADTVVALSQNQDRLKQNQEQIMATLTETQPGAPTDGDFGAAATKGVVGSLAGAGAGALLGATAGSVVPGVGTAVGAAVGGAVSGAASDVTKEGYDFMTENRPGGEGEDIQQMYLEMRQMYQDLTGEGKETGQGGSTGDIDMDAEY